jgi:hypothetical protein
LTKQKHKNNQQEEEIMKRSEKRMMKIPDKETVELMNMKIVDV